MAVHEEGCYPFARGFDGLVRRVLPPEHHDLEVHASRIISGRHEWSHVSDTDRMALLDGIFRHLCEWRGPSGRPLVCFAVVIHKRSFPGRIVVETAYEQLLARFDSFITRRHWSGDSHRSLVIADESAYEQLVQRALPRWKTGVGAPKKMHSLVEVPLFVDSRASRLIQAVDCVAWATWNYYERGHTAYASRIHHLFDCDKGVQHGVTHLVRGYRECRCSACASRQDRVVPDTLAPWSAVLRPTLGSTR